MLFCLIFSRVGGLLHVVSFSSFGWASPRGHREFQTGFFCFMGLPGLELRAERPLGPWGLTYGVDGGTGGGVGGFGG